MTDTVDVDPLADKILALKFTVTEINSILSLLGTLPFVQSVGLINAIQAQCTPQVDALRENNEPQTATA
jgi:hypothetical protein